MTSPSPDPRDRSRSRDLPEAAIDRLLELGKGEEQDRLDSLTLGVDLGKYRVVREIGRGGMGIVFEAEDSHLARRVALKVLPQAAGHSEVFRKRFLREAKSVARLSHPNIAAVYEATPEFIAMQYVRGKDLLESVRGKARLAATLIRDASRAIRYAHSEGVIHRDLKPSNMLVESGDNTDESSKIYVMDFGLAKETSIDSSLSGSGNILGTPAYMPPEQAEGRSQDVDERSDVYGLGATLYACLTGEAPFRGKDVLETLRKVSEVDARPTRVDHELDAILLKCLEKEPKRRYQTAEELANDLDRWLDGVPVQAQKPTWNYRLRKFVVRHRKVVIASACAALVAAGLSVFSWIQVQRNRDVRAAASDAAAFADAIRVVLADADAFRRKGATEDVRGNLEYGLAAVARFKEVHESVGIAHYYEGLLLRGLGRNEDALAAFDRALSLENTLVGARVHRGFVRLAHAERLYREFQKTKSAGSSLVAAGPAELATKARLDDLRKRAIEDLESLSDAQSEATGQLTRVDTFLRSAELSRLRGTLGVAKDLLMLVVESDPTNVDAHRALAQVARARRDHEAETMHIERANSLARDLGYAYAFAQIADGASTASEEDSGAAPELPSWKTNDFSGWARWNPAVPMSEEVVLAPDLDLPICDFASAVRRVPTEAGRLARLAQAAMFEAARTGPGERIGAWQESAGDLSKALAQDASLVAAYSNRGLCWLQIAREFFSSNRPTEALGAVNTARNDFGAALDRDPNFAPAYVGRAILDLDRAHRLEVFGRYRQAEPVADSAIRDLEEARAIVKDPPWLQSVLARALTTRARTRIPIGQVDGAAEDRIRARTILEVQLTQRDTGKASGGTIALYEYAVLLRDIGNRKEAAAQLEQLLERTGADSPLHPRCLELLQQLRN